MGRFMFIDWHSGVTVVAAATAAAAAVIYLLIAIDSTTQFHLD